MPSSECNVSSYNTLILSRISRICRPVNRTRQWLLWTTATATTATCSCWPAGPATRSGAPSWEGPGPPRARPAGSTGTPATWPAPAASPRAGPAPRAAAARSAAAAAGTAAATRPASPTSAAVWSPTRSRKPPRNSTCKLWWGRDIILILKVCYN